MFSKNKKGTNIDLAQHEQIEYAQERIHQKKKLYRHFVFLLIGSVFLVLFNKILKYGETYDWALWIICFWSFLFVMHAVNVFVLKEFMGRNWERKQREILVQKQKDRIAEIQKEVEKDLAPTQIDKKKEL